MHSGPFETEPRSAGVTRRVADQLTKTPVPGTLRALAADRRRDNPPETHVAPDGSDPGHRGPGRSLAGSTLGRTRRQHLSALALLATGRGTPKTITAAPAAGAHKRRGDSRRRGAGGYQAEGRSHVRRRKCPTAATIMVSCRTCATSGSSRATFKCSSHGALRRPHATATALTKTISDRAVTSYFDLKSLRPELGAMRGGGGQSTGFGGVSFARALILARLWANTPCPHQIVAPCRPSRRVRSQP